MRNELNIIAIPWILTGVAILVINLYAGILWVVSSYMLREILSD